MELTDRLAVREYIRKTLRRINAERTLSLREVLLWRIALAARYGAKVIFTNADGSDPYLLRVYLSPRREELYREVYLLLATMHAPIRKTAPLARLLLNTPRPYLHCFFRGDTDRAYHNHPWQESASLILTNGYTEHRWDFEKQRDVARVFRPGQVNMLGRDAFHRVELLEPGECWTLFVSGRPARSVEPGSDWHFFEPKTSQYTPWAQWVEARPE